MERRMKNKTMKDPAQIKQILHDAKRARDYYAALLVEGNLNEDQFKRACEGVARTAIIKAALTSLEVMR